MPTFMHPLMGANLSTLLKAFSRQGGVSFSCLPHAAAFLGFACCRLPATLLERAMMGRQELEPDNESEPIFVVGHWRSGTTHLHNLLGCAPQFGIITPLASGMPWELLTLATWFRPLFEKGLPEDRGVDKVAVTAQSPQEDEIPLANMQQLSVFHAVYFPEAFQKNFDEGVLFEGVNEDQIQKWERRALYLYRKISRHQNGKRLLIKNPVYTARIDRLIKLWSKARFIHIYRNPYVVYSSTVHYYKKLLPELALQKFDNLDIEEMVLKNYPPLMSKLEKDAGGLKENQFAEVRFEDLEKDPMGILEKIYQQLEITGWDEASVKTKAYLESLSSYRKNKFSLAEKDQQRVRERWGKWIDQWDYPAPDQK